MAQTFIGNRGKGPTRGNGISVGATCACLPKLRRGSKECAVVAATNRVGPVSPMPCTALATTSKGK